MAKYSIPIRVAALVKKGFTERAAQNTVERQLEREALKKLGVYTDKRRLEWQRKKPIDYWPS